MAAPPWRRALSALYNINSPSHSHSHGPFQSKDTLLAYAKGMHSALTKLTGFRNPFFLPLNCIMARQQLLIKCGTTRKRHKGM